MSNPSNAPFNSSPNYSRSNPYQSKIIKRNLLSKASSSKKTYHISLAIDESITFKPGDSIGIYPENTKTEIDLLIELVPFSEKINEQTKELFKSKNLQLLTNKLIQFILPLLSEDDQNNLQQKILEEDFLKSHDIISLLKNFTIVKPVDIEHFEQVLPPMLPRFYSIASALSYNSKELHLLVGTFSYEFHGRVVSGLGSTFLCHHAQIDETTIPFFIHPSRHFSLPSSEVPIIMIGPGTGVAPFRSFIHERIEQKSTKNWLFFGERTRENDFYYEEEFLEYEKEGFLHLSLAFSRDQERKVYVQDKIYEKKDQFYEWIKAGAIVYVCGDAKKMAKDVQEMICKILGEKESLNENQSLERFKELKRLQKIIFEVY